MFGMAENIYGSVDNMIMIEFLFHQSMIFTTNCFDGLEETYFCLISRVFWTVEKNNQCLGTVHGFSMLLIDMISFLCLRYWYSTRSENIFWRRKINSTRVAIKFNGMPFVVLGCKTMDCRHGKDHAISRKIKAKSKKKKKMEDKVV